MHSPLQGEEEGERSEGSRSEAEAFLSSLHYNDGGDEDNSRSNSDNSRSRSKTGDIALYQHVGGEERSRTKSRSRSDVWGDAAWYRNYGRPGYKEDSRSKSDSSRSRSDKYDIALHQDSNDGGFGYEVAVDQLDPKMAKLLYTKSMGTRKTAMTAGPVPIHYFYNRFDHYGFGGGSHGKYKTGLDESNGGIGDENLSNSERG